MDNGDPVFLYPVNWQKLHLWQRQTLAENEDISLDLSLKMLMVMMIIITITANMTTMLKKTYTVALSQRQTVNAHWQLLYVGVGGGKGGGLLKRRIGMKMISSTQKLN